MKVLPFDLKVVTTGPAEGQKFEYITPGAQPCEVTGIKTSDQLDDYKGSPFIDYAVTSNGKVGRCRFWVVKEEDKPSTKEWKTKQIKDFLINAGVRDFSDDSKAINSLMITFISEEYIGTNRDTSEPVIRTSVKYRWSAKSGGKCTYNANMNQELSEEEMSEFSMKHSEWSKANQAVSASSDDEDMPF